MTHLTALITDSAGRSHMGGLMGGVMVGWTLLVVLAVALGLLVAGLIGGNNRQGSSPGAKELLDGRYARGEIDRDDYLQRRADLER